MKEKILVVEDSKMLIQDLKKRIERLGFEVLEAVDCGEKAIEITKHKTPDLIVMDIGLEGELDGISTVIEIRKHKNIPVVYITGHVDYETLERAKTTNPLAYIPKPYNSLNLDIALEVAINKIRLDKRLDNYTQELELLVAERTRILENEISERIEIEKKLKDANEKLAKSDSLKTSFLANISHEIRTPMHAIIGFADLLVDTETTQDERNEYRAVIAENCASLSTIISDIIDIAKINSGQTIVKKKKCVISSLLSDIFAKYNSQFKVFQQEIVKLKLDIPKDLLKLKIETDPERLTQVLSRLIENAIKFTEKGKIEFGYSIHKEKLKFFVKDTGIGIAKRKFDFIFEEFTKLEENPTQLFGGIGIGLPLSKRIIEQLGGKMWIESEINKGTTVYFTLKADLSEKLEDETPNLSKQDNWNDKLILIAEDDDSNYRFLKVVLSKTGAKLLWTKNGDEALRLYRKYPQINMILLDIKMPVTSGLDAAREIRKYDKDVPLIAQTAYALSIERERCLNIGFDQYLVKPIIKNELLGAMNKLIHRKQSNEIFSDIFNWKNKKLLIVEDEMMHYNALKTILSKTGITILYAPDPESALKITDTDKNIDICLLDIYLPNQKGYDLAKEILKTIPDMPIIAISSYIFDKGMQTLKESGIVDFIRKPIESTLLLSKIALYI